MSTSTGFSPVAPTGANNWAAPTGSLIPGAAGTLGGTNVLQQSIDTLNNTVENLITAITSSSGFSNNSSQGNITRQQNSTSASSGGFPGMFNFFRQGNVTGGGNAGGGTAGVGSITSGGMAGAGMAIGGAIAGWGANNMSNMVALNSYATQSLTGLNYNGMSQSQAMRYLYSQAGANPGSQIGIGTGTLSDNLGMVSTLQQRAGSLGVNQTAIGRAALGGTYSFGLSNPTVTATTAAQMASALYSPTFSLNMMSMGYKPVLSQTPGGKPVNAGQTAMNILNTMNLGKMKSNQVFGNLSSGVGQSNLTYLLQGTGITNAQMTNYLTDYAQLINNKGLTPQQAASLMNSAGTNNKAARNRLAGLGVNTANNDLSALVSNQAAVTSRSGAYASSFNQGLQDSAGLLHDFNNILTTIVKGPLGSLIGYSGGSLGTMAGSALGSGANMLGSVGSYMLVKKLLGGGASTAATSGASAAGSTAGAAATSAGATAGVTALGILGGSIIANKLAPQSAKSGNMVPRTNPAAVGADNIQRWIHNLENYVDPFHYFGGGGSTQASTGGGAVGMSMGSSQQITKGNSSTASVTGSAKKAVSLAETQVGVPYQYGAELPGVGFDCSALVQWAYKRAGITLPRTSQQQWSALAKRSVPLDRVQEGDLVFTAGSDGSSNSPGHVGMMVNSHQVIQAPHTGQDVEIVNYNPSSWQHAARPTGSGSFIAGTAGMAGSTRGYGNAGVSLGLGGSYGSSNEASIINSSGSYLGGASISGNGISGSNNTITGGASPVRVSSSGRANEAIGKRLAQAYGWSSGKQWNDLVALWNMESGWNNNAQNPTSTAYGIAQFLDTTWQGYGPKTSSPQLQIKYGLEYIKQRYGNPSGAWQHEMGTNPHWYGAGGQTLPGLSIVGDRGPELMMEGGGNQVFSNSQTMQLINAIRGSSPAQSPWKTDITSGYSSNSSNKPVNVNFNSGSIVVHSSGTSSQAVTQSGREIARQIIKHLNSAAINNAIRQGEKL